MANKATYNYLEEYLVKVQAKGRYTLTLNELRKKFNVYVTVEYKQCSGKFPYYRICLEDDEIVSIPFETYEEALETALYKALTILKKKKL